MYLLETRFQLGTFAAYIARGVTSTRILSSHICTAHYLITITASCAPVCMLSGVCGFNRSYWTGGHAPERSLSPQSWTVPVCYQPLVCVLKHLPVSDTQSAMLSSFAALIAIVSARMSWLVERMMLGYHAIDVWTCC